MDIGRELLECGLIPGTWKEALVVIRGALSPADWDKFNRLHAGFVGYRSTHTSDKFYGFVFANDLHMEINRPRHARLSQILKALSEEISPGQAILDVGAGAGIIASIIKAELGPSAYVVQDSCREAQHFLAQKGFEVLAYPTPAQPPRKPFDLILCVDSLGEVNADEDDLLSENSPVKEQDYPKLLEERYGIAQKLKPWKVYLAPNGRILFWEPFKHKRAWNGLSKLLQVEGWKTRYCNDLSGAPYLEIHLP